MSDDAYQPIHRRRLMRRSIVGMLALVGILVFFNRTRIFGPHPIHLREQWNAGRFDLSEAERERLRNIPIKYSSFIERYADLFEAKGMSHATISYPTEPVIEHELPAAFRADPTRKVAVTSETFLQFFEAYSHQKTPVFITSDSILNAFHRILEDSIIHLEFRQVEQLRSCLPAMEEQLSRATSRNDSEVMRSATRRARIVLAVAHQLIDPDYQPDSDIQPIVEQEVERIESGKGQIMPDWLGEPRPSILAIDYSLFEPQGFHTRSDTLRRHFRAVKWLKAIPFSVDDDGQLLSLIVISESANGTQWPAFAGAYGDFFGRADDWDLQTLSSIETNAVEPTDALQTVRDQLQERYEAEGPPSLVNDQIATQFSPQSAQDVSLRILAAFRTPESVLFQSVGSSGGATKSIGLLLCAALGSDYARQQLESSNSTHAGSTVGRNELALMHDDESVYGEYLQCLKTLLLPVDASPDFMSTDHWKMKSCQTVLGGWTQMRHTFSLQAKQHAQVLGDSPRIGAGFVEPNPDFYRRLGSLASRIETSLDELGVFEINFARLDDRLNDLTRSYSMMRMLDEKDLRNYLAPEDEAFRNEVYALIGDSDPGWWLDDPFAGDYFDRALAAMVQIADDIKCGELPEDRGARGAILSSELVTARVRWLRLCEVCERLEDVANKQLKEEPLSKDDEWFILGYGEELAALLNYREHAADSPIDNAMRCISVCTDSEGNHVHVAVTRPQAIFIQYSHSGQTLLCRGAVFPYHEFTDRQIVNDPQWQARVNARRTPRRPSWLQPLFVDD